MRVASGVWQRHSFAALSAISSVPAISAVPAVPTVSSEQLLLRAGAMRVQEGRAARGAHACADTASRAAAIELIVAEQHVSADQAQIAYDQQQLVDPSGRAVAADAR
jgi:hypothetical protein